MLNINDLPTVVKAIKPMADRVLIAIDDVETETKGGILLTSYDQETQQIGEIIAVGNSPTISVKVGEKALFGKYAGVRFEEEGLKLLFIKEADLLAIIEKD
ncbi:MAG: GroES chaperonin family protein [Bacteriophage sp.]|nr:MAG: GroES chaperonin family protein [Bacteriophage sp.]